MNKINTLEELAAAKQELIATAKLMENSLHEDIKNFSSRFQPILSLFNGSGSSGKISSLLIKGAATVIPLILSRRKTAVAATSPWMALGTTALGLLTSGQANGLLDKVGNFIGALKRKKKRRHRRHLLDRIKGK